MTDPTDMNNGYGGDNSRIPAHYTVSLDPNIPAAAAAAYSETPPPPTKKQLLLIIAFAIIFTPYVLLVKCFLHFLGAFSIEENLRRRGSTPAPVPEQALAQEGVSFLKWIGIIIALFLCLIINLFIDALRTTTFFGYHLWKWCFLGFIFSFIHIFTNKAVMIDTNNTLKKMYGQIAGKSTSYYVTELLERVISVMTFGSVLLGWVFFFRGQITPYSSDLIIGLVDGYGTLVVVFMFVRAVVRFLNTAFLLKWKSKALFFNEFAEGRVLKAGFHMFYVYNVLRINPNILSPLIQPWRKRQITLNASRGVSNHNYESSWNDNDPKDVTTEELWAIAQYAEAYALVMPGAGTIEVQMDGVRDSCQTMLAPLDGSEYFNQRLLQEKLNISELDSELLYDELQRAYPSQQVSYSIFEEWIVNAYKESMEVGKHLVALENMVVETNRILIANLMIQACLTWFFLTGRTITKVVVVIPTVFVVRHFISTLLSPECGLLVRSSAPSF